jgi:quercetin dioxygenase-like cupin family protein
MRRTILIASAMACLAAAVMAVADDKPKMPTGADASQAAKGAMGEMKQTAGQATMTGKQMAGSAMGARTTKLSQLTWQDAPGYVAGVKMAPVYGMEQGAKSAYLKFPASTKIAAHTHPAYHWGTVVSGTGTFGFGTDPAKGIEYGPGDYFEVPTSTEHWLMAKTETTIFGCMMGPDGIAYVNATDDPRKGQATSQ